MNSDSEGEELFEDSQNPDIGTDDDFYDVEGKGRNSRQKRTSKDDSQNDGTNASPTFDMNYTQLKNFAGLTSPLASATIQTQEQASQKDSVVSSLSSMSHDEVDNRGAVHAERRSSQETHNSDVSDVSKSNNSEDVDGLYMNRFNDPEVLSKMNKLLSSVTAEGSPNPYFPRESVKITSDKTQTLFKDKLRLVQRLKQHEGAIWTMKISPLGGFLATAGQDTRVLVWRITPLPFELSHTPQKVDALFSPTPFRVYEGHTGDVIDLAWSKSNFILSASTDKTVRLWHITRNDCLQFFRHADIVTSVEFHPAHDRFFISGCFDRRLRLWDIIPDGNVREWAQAPETITSVCFSPDGQTIAVGLIRGQIYFYEYEGMKYKTQMNCRNRSGKYKHGTKVTGMCFTSARKGGANQDLLSAAGAAEKLGTSSGGGTGTGERIQSGGRARKSLNANSQLLVTTNDSRIRLCHLEDYSMLCKYKGLRNKSMQIKASFSEDGRLVICGSETGTVVVWNTLPPARGLGLGSLFGGGKQNRNTASEAFDCTSNTDTATTVAVFAPSATIHTLCKEWNRLNSPSSATSALTSSVAGASTTAEAGGLPNVVNFADREAVTSDFCSRIIVTADYTGAVSVYFRLT